MIRPLIYLFFIFCFSLKANEVNTHCRKLEGSKEVYISYFFHEIFMKEITEQKIVNTKKNYLEIKKMLKKHFESNLSYRRSCLINKKKHSLSCKVYHYQKKYNQQVKKYCAPIRKITNDLKETGNDFLSIEKLIDLNAVIKNFKSINLKLKEWAIFFSNPTFQSISSSLDKPSSYDLIQAKKFCLKYAEASIVYKILLILKERGGSIFDSYLNQAEAQLLEEIQFPNSSHKQLGKSSENHVLADMSDIKSEISKTITSRVKQSIIFCKKLRNENSKDLVQRVCAKGQDSIICQILKKPVK